MMTSICSPPLRKIKDRSWIVTHVLHTAAAKPDHRWLALTLEAAASIWSRIPIDHIPVDMPFETAEGNRPIYIASKYGTATTRHLRLLLDHGANPNALNGSFSNVFHVSVRASNYETIQFWMEYDPELFIAPFLEFAIRNRFPMGLFQRFLRATELVARRSDEKHRFHVEIGLSVIVCGVFAIAVASGLVPH